MQISYGYLELEILCMGTIGFTWPLRSTKIACHIHSLPVFEAVVNLNSLET